MLCHNEDWQEVALHCITDNRRIIANHIRICHLICCRYVDDVLAIFLCPLPYLYSSIILDLLKTKTCTIISVKLYILVLQPFVSPFRVLFQWYSLRSDTSTIAIVPNLLTHTTNKQKRILCYQEPQQF